MLVIFVKVIKKYLQLSKRRGIGHIYARSPVHILNLASTSESDESNSQPILRAKRGRVKK